MNRTWVLTLGFYGPITSVNTCFIMPSSSFFVIFFQISLQQLYSLSKLFSSYIYLKGSLVVLNYFPMTGHRHIYRWCVRLYSKDSNTTKHATWHLLAMWHWQSFMRWGLYLLPLDLGGLVSAVEVILCAFRGYVLTGKTTPAWPFGGAYAWKPRKGKDLTELLCESVPGYGPPPRTQPTASTNLQTGGWTRFQMIRSPGL